MHPERNQAVFTFHNVSINSIFDLDDTLYNLNLHSIMYLLIQKSIWDCSRNIEIYIP